MYHVFRGSFHDTQAQFPHQSRMENNGRDLGLFLTTDVSFPGHCYNINCCIRCIQTLKATVPGSPWSELKNKRAIIVRAIADVNSDLYWRQFYVVLCTVFPALLDLQLANYNNATMDKIYYCVHKATLAIEMNADNLDNPSLFPPPEEDDGKNGYKYPESSTEESN